MPLHEMERPPAKLNTICPLHEMESLLALSGLEIVKVTGLGILARELREAKYDFPEEGRCVQGEPTWYVTPKGLNIESSKKTLFMFNPREHSAPFGKILVDALDLALGSIHDTAAYRSCVLHGEIHEAVGIHYYSPGDYIKGHRDIGLISCLWSTGPTTFYIPKNDELVPIKISKDKNDNPDVLIEEDDMLCMFGLSAQLLGCGKAVYHEVSSVDRDKFTFGIFLEVKNKGTVYILPDGRQISYGEFAKNYFDTEIVDESIYTMKSDIRWAHG